MNPIFDPILEEYQRGLAAVVSRTHGKETGALVALLAEVSRARMTLPDLPRLRVIIDSCWDIIAEDEERRLMASAPVYPDDYDEGAQLDVLYVHYMLHGEPVPDWWLRERRRRLRAARVAFERDFGQQQVREPAAP